MAFIGIIYCLTTLQNMRGLKGKCTKSSKWELDTEKNLDLLMHMAILGLITTQKVLFLGLKY